MSRLLPALAAACVAGAAWTILRLVSGEAASLDPASLSWPWVGGAATAMLLFVLLYAHASARLLRAVSGEHVSYSVAFRFFLLTWPGRYVPAGVPYYGGRIVAAPSVGVSRSAMAVAMMYESLLAIVGAGSVSLSLAALALHGRVPGALWMGIAAAGLVGAAAALHPAFCRCAVRLAARRIRRLESLEEHLLPGSHVPRLVAIYALAAVFAGVALFAALRAIDVHAPLALVCVAYNVAGIVGMLAVPLPSGMGVREAAVVALLAGVVSPSDALTAALLARIAGVGSDLAPFTAVVVWQGIRRLVPVSMPPGAAGSRLTEAG